MGRAFELWQNSRSLKTTARFSSKTEMVKTFGDLMVHGYVAEPLLEQDALRWSFLCLFIPGP
jgi:hypothetical protein